MNTKIVIDVWPDRNTTVEEANVLCIWSMLDIVEPGDLLDDLLPAEHDDFDLDPYATDLGTRLDSLTDKEDGYIVVVIRRRDDTRTPLAIQLSESDGEKIFSAKMQRSESPRIYYAAIPFIPLSFDSETQLEITLEL